MRLSISTKIFVGFLTVLATFGGVVAFGAYTMRRLGDELRLVSRGYLELRLDVSELQTAQSSLLRVLVEQRARPGVTLPRFMKLAIDEARRARLKQQLPRLLSQVRALEALRFSVDEQQLLSLLRARLERIDAAVRADEELFDEVYGPVGHPPAGPEKAAADGTTGPAEQLLRREQWLRRDLANLAAELRLRAEQAGMRLEESENRAVWAMLLLAVIAVAVSLLVMRLAARTLRPLQRLAERAKEIARGDYGKRVEAGSGDEIGALGQEFNAMAAALEEREQRLIRSERLAAVGRIAAQITHEVRNPLSSIGLNAELLEDEVAQLSRAAAQVPPPGGAVVEEGAGAEGGAEARALVRAIGKEVDRLTEITEAYLRFARLPRPRLEREDLNAIVESLLSFLRPELTARGVEIDAALPRLPAVSADEQQLRQALLNLCRNAAEAMEGGGRLSVRGEAGPAGQVTLRVADTGPGIAPEHLPQIFEPFFSTKRGGTGLGLALTQQIMVEHGGAIEVDSAPGRGTTFVLRLPALADA